VAFARSVREAGLITSRGRGPSAAEMNEADAANLLIAVNAAETARAAPDTVRRFRALRMSHENQRAFGAVLEEMIAAAVRNELFCSPRSTTALRPLAVCRAAPVLRSGFFPATQAMKSIAADDLPICGGAISASFSYGEDLGLQTNGEIQRILKEPCYAIAFAGTKIGLPGDRADHQRASVSLSPTDRHRRRTACRNRR
jgi:hypothetical protein